MFWSIGYKIFYQLLTSYVNMFYEISLGANGAGKTTTFRMLINDIKATSGSIIINGKNISKTVNK